MSLILFVIGAKGGVGTTTLTVDLAKRFSDKGSTLLVDGDLSGRRSIASLYNRFAALDERRAVDGVGVAAITQNLTLSNWPQPSTKDSRSSPERIDEFFVTAAGQSDTIIVDAPQPFAAAVRPFAVRSAGFILIVQPTLLGVTGARSMQLELQKFGVPAGRMIFIASTIGPKAEISNADIQRALSVELVTEIPSNSDKRYERAIQSLQELSARFRPRRRSCCGHRPARRWVNDG